MDELRRILPTISPAKAMRKVRRVQEKSDTAKPAPPRDRIVKPPRLRGAERALADALTQLRDGVPLNWGQVEDDAELFTLARLQGAAQESRFQPTPEPAAGERAEWLERLAKRLPSPKVKKEKVAPKSLAGFSDRVQVLTQVEEDVPMNTSLPKLILRGAAAVAVVGLVVYGLYLLVSSFTTPTFRWIEVRKGSEVLTRVLRPSGWQQYPCKVERLQNPLITEWFHTYTAMRIVQDKLTFEVPALPLEVNAPNLHKLEFGLASVASCDPSKEISKDPGAMLKLDYVVRQTLPDSSALTGASGSSAGDKEVVVPLVAYIAKEQPLPLSVRNGTWREVNLKSARGGPDLHGVIWRGDSFHDRSGVAWYGEVIVLMVEQGNMTLILEGATYDFLTEEFLLEVARNIVW